MESSNIKSEQLKLLMSRIPYVETVFQTEEIYNAVLNNLYEDSKYIGLSLRFPFDDYYELELPKKYLNWQIRCAIELYNGIGKENIVKYAENGIEWTRDSSAISKYLRNEINQKVGIPKKEVLESEQ